jgi:hypothetical protein
MSRCSGSGMENREHVNNCTTRSKYENSLLNNEPPVLAPAKSRSNFTRCWCCQPRSFTGYDRLKRSWRLGFPTKRSAGVPVALPTVGRDRLQIPQRRYHSAQRPARLLGRCVHIADNFSQSIAISGVMQARGGLRWEPTA